MHAAAMLILAADVVSASQARPTGCADEIAQPFCKRAATIWCGTAETVPFEDLALHTAPILWYSPDEPLLREGRPVPQELAFSLGEDGLAQGSDRRVVYWQVDKLKARTRDKVKTDDLIRKGHVLPVAEVETLNLSFFFYYERDLGMNPHYHDLEGAVFQLHVEAAPPNGDPRDEGFRRVYIGRATGLGHGSGLLSNILQIKPSIRKPAGAPDVTLPLTILVEEGKHASCPDRNGDGVYTPGYDVNVRVPDAWGLRDVFGTGVVSSQYQPWMSKSRHKKDRYAVDASRFAGDDPFSPVRCYKTGMELVYPDDQHHYDLRRAPRCSECGSLSTDRPFCEVACQGDDWKPLGERSELPKTRCLSDNEKAGSMKCKQLNMDLRVRQAFIAEPRITFASLDAGWLKWGAAELDFRHGDNWQIQSFKLLAPSIRFDGRDFGFGLSYYFPFGLPKFSGWPAVRFGLIREDGAFYGRFDFSYTASIARLSDVYLALGYDWGLERTHLEETAAPDGSATGLTAHTRREDSWAVESGVQVRYRAFGLRVGLRGSIAGGRIDPLRVVAELAYGPNPEHAKVH